MSIPAFGLAIALVAGRADDSPPASLDSVDHAALIRAWDDAAFRRGEQLYGSVCITCHGDLTRAGSLPTSRAFWKEPFKNGHDPLSLYRTLDQGLGQMPAWGFLDPTQRYDLIHYVREAFLKPHNPGAYLPLSEAYLAGLPKGTGIPFARTAAMLAFQQGPPYLRMDFGPLLFWTLEVAPDNIAYKGIAVRLDPGPGGISKGHAWILYDHDTLRAAAAWTGDEFVDWKGIAFDGSHQTHTRIVGEKTFVNPAGPGWADPRTGTFDDPRLRGRDGKPYGPLPRDWAHFRGAYLHGHQVVLAYTVGDADLLELPGVLRQGARTAFTRTLDIGRSRHDLLLRIAPTDAQVDVVGLDPDRIQVRDGVQVLSVRATDTPVNLRLAISLANPVNGPVERAGAHRSGEPPAKLAPLTIGGPARWNPPVATRGVTGSDEGPFAVDELTHPDPDTTPGHPWMRFGGFDFFADGRRAAIATWNGDVWLVSGIDGDLGSLVWQRIATGLFQPLGLRIVEDTIHVACRDMIARLRDLNGDGEIDLVENFNNDHQVTEHFHEFAMGLQTDADGNFYYAKSARHALPALVPHHGTLLRVTRDGSRTDIVANGFRAANGVCVNDDGTFFVTDQEGHWTPKNRINLVRAGGFYGNLFGYHDRTGSADADMEPPLVWITNEMDRSPGELVHVRSPAWGPLNGALLNLSYGTGRIFLVPYESVDRALQGGVVQLPIPDFPTGVMRGRFHPGNGHLYVCGLYAWAGNRLGDGGFYRVRATGKPIDLPVRIHATTRGLQLAFTSPLDATAARDASRYALKAWSLRRSADYGSPHVDEHPLPVAAASLSDDATTVMLEVPGLAPTWGMEIAYDLRSREGRTVRGRIHNSIHRLARDPQASARP